MVTQGLIFEYFHFWKGMLVQKGLVFDNFTLGGSGGLESTDIGQFTLGGYNGPERH